MIGGTFSGTRQFPLLTLLLLVSGSVSKASIIISLTNQSNFAMSFREYRYIVFYDTKFSSIDSGGMTGFLHQPEPKSGCSTIKNGPNASNATDTWFAVIENFPCTLSTVMHNARAAGYDLIVVADNGSTTLSADDRKMEFPTVIISKNYTDYLIEKALSEFQNPEVQALVEADADFFVIVLVMASMFVAIPTCTVFYALCCYCRAQRLRRYRYDNIHRRRHFNRLTDRDGIARRELIDSILRQLQQLQLEGEIQQPLGAEQTRKLPTRRFERMSSSESCAICVDEFKEKDMVRELPCKHYFHINCIDEWLTNHSDVCPLCKSQVPKEVSEDDRHTGRRNAAMAPFDEDEETDSEPLVSTERQLRQGRVYGSFNT